MKTKKILKPFSIEAWKSGAKVQTKDGQPVRILCTDAKIDTYDIVGLLEEDGENIVMTWDTNGRHFHRCEEDKRNLVIVEEVEEPEQWADYKDAKGDGWYLNLQSRCVHAISYLLNEAENYNLFATEKQAKSALAMARISQLMAHDPRYGGVVTDEEWKSQTERHIIYRFHGEIRPDTYLTGIFHFLAFHTAEQRDLFLKENEQLVKDYLMVD